MPETIDLGQLERLNDLATQLHASTTLTAESIKHIMDYLEYFDEPENEIARMQLIRACVESRDVRIVLARYGLHAPPATADVVEDILVARRTRCSA